MQLSADLSDNNVVNENLKEAVAESIINLLHQRISGIGKYGQFVLDKKPSQRFVSGFLESHGLAELVSRDVDPSVNPVHLISSGVDFEVYQDNKGLISVAPTLSIYVRILPTTEDLEKYPTQISLNAETKDLLHTKVREQIRKFEAETPKPEEKTDSGEWYKARAELRANVYTEVLNSLLGQDLTVHSTNDTVLSEEQLLDSITLRDGESSVENVPDDEHVTCSEDVTLNDSGPESFAYVVYPGIDVSLPEGIFNNTKPVQKWQRIELENLPGFEFHSDEDISKLKANLAQYNQEINNIIKARIIDWTQDDGPSGGKNWAYPKKLAVGPREIQNWKDTLEIINKDIHHVATSAERLAIPDLDFALVVEVHFDQERSTNRPIRQIRVAIENQTKSSDPLSPEVEDGFFQESLQVTIPRDTHRPVNLGRVKPSYQYARYLRYPAIGFNSGLNFHQSDDCIHITTTWMPVYRQPRIRPIPYSHIPVGFAELTKESGLVGLKLIKEAFDEWIIEAEKDSVDNLIGSNEHETVTESNQFKHDKSLWEKESEKINTGVLLLLSSLDAYKSDPTSIEATPYRAWCLLNETMMKVGGNRFDKWRLFQLAFILANITGICSRITTFKDLYDPVWDESVSLLYFATGGGKTESFFGLLVFNLFLDRLRGKKNGVTAMIRYPLRLLTIQQAQRLARTLAKAEGVRRVHKLPGDAFSIGFWVGSNNTPNGPSGYTDSQIPKYKSDINEKELSGNYDYQIAKENWNKLPECPFCGAPTALRAFSRGGKLLGHVCTNASKNCSWNEWHHESLEPLPFYIVDTDIYKKAPSVILGTVDKLALIANSPTTIRKVFGMFGMAPFLDSVSRVLQYYETPKDIKELGKQHIKLKPFFNNGENFFYDPFPSLIIQDEAHLLEESLGTFSGIFETAYERILKDMSDAHSPLRQITAQDNLGHARMPKIIAASATVTEPERQMQGLYQREVVQFPAPGHKLYFNFYAKPDPSDIEARAKLDEVELSAKTARLYSSILTNGRPHTSATVETLAYFHLTISRLITDLCSGDKSLESSAADSLIEALEQSLSPFKAYYRDELTKASSSVLATLVDLHRIALTYVTNKKGGDQIMSAEGDMTCRIHEEDGLPLEELISELISGAVNAGEIEAVIEKAEDRPSPGEPIPDVMSPGILRSVVATSAISHGVDVDEFNSMFFAGMPSVAAEYIQSSSRVGRTHVGLSTLIPTPQRRRDRYVIETHDQYHRFLERMIRPAPVNRWAENAIIRTLPSLIQVFFIMHREMVDTLRADDEQKSLVENHDHMSVLISVKTKITENTLLKELKTFVFNAVGLNHDKHGPPADVEIKSIIDRAIAEITEHLLEDNPGITTFREAYRDLESSLKSRKIQPMTSLRDVDPSGILTYAKTNTAAPDAESIKKLMTLIKKRGKA